MRKIDPKVSIVILNWNGYQDTVECLESLRKITYTNYEIIVVDNASGGEDVLKLRQRYGASIHVIANDQNCGFPEGNNIGFRYALQRGADYLMPLNNDVIVDPDFLTELINVAESRDDCGIAGAVVYMYYERDRIECAGGRIYWWLGAIETLGGKDHGQYSAVAERDFVYANGCIIKRSVTDQISLFNPFFFFGIEEYDYCSRVRKVGYKVLSVPSSRIWHKHGASSDKLPLFPETQALVKQKGGFRYYKYSYRLFKENCPPILFIFPFLMYTSLVGNLLLSIWRGDWKTVWSGIYRRLKVLMVRSLK